MRIRTALVAALPTILLIGVPLAAHATGVPFFGPIIPPSGGNGNPQVCAAGWGALAQVVNNIIAFVITILILMVTPFMIAWAGFLYVFSPANPSNRSRANGILTNTAIGIFFALAAWLIIDTLLTSLQTVTDTGAAGGVQSFTERLFNGGDWCLPIETQKLSQAPQSSLVDSSQTAACADGSTLTNGACQTCTMGGCDYSMPLGYSCSGGGTFDASTGQCQVCTGGDEGGCTQSSPVAPSGGGNYGVSGAQCASDNTACSVSALQGAGFTEAQANAMSCIAALESTGNPNNVNPGSGACGTFQFVGSTWSSLSSRTAGCNGASCTNASCNLQVAYTAAQNRQSLGQSIYSDWTCAGCNSKAQGCVNTYDPGH